MFYQLLYIHLFRPFLRYNHASSPLPPHVSPRRLCTQAAASISKLLRQYKRTFGLRQICNVAVYIAHSACTIHLLNLPDPSAKRDIVSGVQHLEEIAQGWPCASRTLKILDVLAQRWNIVLPDEAAAVLARLDHADSGRAESSSPSVSTILSNSAPTLAFPAIESFPGRVGSTSAALHGSTAVTEVEPMADRSYSAPRFGQVVARSDSRPHSQSHSPRPSALMGDTGTSPHRPVDPVSDMAGSAPPVGSTVLLASPAGLVQHSQDWWYRDQSDYAAGFDNWHCIGSDQPIGELNENLVLEAGVLVGDGLDQVSWC